MKIEYLSEGAQECPLVRIYGRNHQEFEKLFKAVNSLTSNEKVVHVHELPGFVSIGNCELTLQVGEKDEGILQHENSTIFNWILTVASWEIIAKLIEPFCMESNSKFHQWLAGEEASYGFHISRISLLITNREEGNW